MSDPFFNTKPIIVIRKVLFIFIIKICQKYQDFYPKKNNCFNDMFNAIKVIFLKIYQKYKHDYYIIKHCINDMFNAKMIESELL